MKRSKFILLVLLVVVPISTICSSSIGAANISSAEIISVIANRLSLPLGIEFSPQTEAIIWNIRLPRVLMSLVAGAALALCGAAMQGLFRNPLADPSILGVSSSAALTTSFAIVLLGPYLLQWQESLGIAVLPFASFVGAVGSIYLIFSLARAHGKIHVSTMLLGGIAINALAGAGIGLLTYMADDAQLRSLTFWTLGSLGGINWGQLGLMSVVLILSLTLILPLAKNL
ncbi:MAG: iron chelate uptake ABC transporter family permease subunit, partial [Bacteroidota bacterium]